MEQISESKKTRKISAQRESFTIAAQKCELYTDVIVPLINKINNELSEKKIEVLERSTLEIIWGKLKWKLGFLNEEERDTVMIKMGTLDLLNKLDALAVFFVAWVANDDVGYLNFGRSFCYTGKRFIPLIADFYELGHYQSLIDLYTIWQRRITQEELEKQKIQIARNHWKRCI